MQNKIKEYFKELQFDAQKHSYDRIKYLYKNNNIL